MDRVQLGVTCLEARDVPALYAVALVNDPTGVGVMGDAGATHTGGFAASANYVEAADPAEAVSLALTGTFTVTLGAPDYDSRTYQVRENGASQVGNSQALHLPFTLQDQGGGKYQLQNEDLAKFGNADWDYNDHYWNLTVWTVETVAGRMWADDDGDGIQGVSELGMPDRNVQLLKDGQTAGAAQTGADGEYSFQVPHDPTASYTVQFEQPAGFDFTTPFAGGDRTLDSDADAGGQTPEVFTSSLPHGAIGGGLVAGIIGRQWTVRAPETLEGNRVGQTHQMTFTVTRRTNLDKPSAIGYTTIDGTATAGQDYTAAAGVLNFAVGQQQQTVTVDIKEDLVKENDEEFFLVLKTRCYAVAGGGSVNQGLVR